MSGALGLTAAFVGFACLVYAGKGSHGTQWDGTIAPGPIFKQLLLGNWPYGQSGSVVQTGTAPYSYPTTSSTNPYQTKPPGSGTYPTKPSGSGTYPTKPTTGTIA